MDGFALTGFYFQDVDLGEWCPSGDGGCRSEVFVYRIVGYQAHGTCQTHNIFLRMPSWLLPGFSGQIEDPGEWVLIQDVDENGNPSKELGKVNLELIPRFLDDGLQQQQACIASVAYLADQSMCLRFEYVVGGKEITVPGTYLDSITEEIRSHLHDGFGILCVVDLDNTGQVFWPEYPLASYQQLFAA